MLVRNWQTNQLIAAGRLRALNAINLSAALVSLLPLAFLGVAPLEACAATLVIYPLAFVVPAWIAAPGLRPRALALGGDTARAIMAAGFLVFLAGMLLQVNIQIERWYVTLELGVEALGHLFVATMFVTLLQLVPNALNAVFLPSAVAANSADDDAALRRTMRRYVGALAVYAAAAGLAVWLLAEPVLALLAPGYIPDLAYVYLIAPGALAITIAGAFGLGFVVVMRYRAMIAAYMLGTIALALACLIAVASGGQLTLEGITLARSAALGVTAMGVMLGWWLLAREHRGLRLFDRGGSRD
jgi:O-antigen/teichoic acid export membrane protein